MPKKGSVGVSANTQLKQNHFRMFMQAHMRIVQSIMEHNQWVFPRYIYFDLNAGPGRYEDEEGIEVVGSPIQTLTVADGMNLPVWAWFCEQDKNSCELLRAELRQRGMQERGDEFTDGATSAWLYEGSYTIGLPQSLSVLLDPSLASRQYYGLIYSDENGSLPPFALLRLCAQQLRYCDILIHAAAAPIKRQFYSPVHPLMRRLDELMATVPKDCWIVRDPYGKHQWSFLIGTNWDAFPRFKRQGFWAINSPEGASILRRLSLNREEFNGQGDLFIP